jgi:ferredoxin
MAITKVWLDESENECTMCGACEAVADAVFSVPEKMVVKAGVDFSKYEADIRDAAMGCPVATIAYEIDGSGKRNNK